MLNKAFESPCLIPYLTYADPDPVTFRKLAETAIECGASILEIGLPFSDPIADGPVIQASHQRALVHKPKIIDVLECVSQLKEKYSVPIILMGALNLIEHFGIKHFFKSAQEKGVDGVVIPDLLYEEMGPYKEIARNYQVSIITLMSPLCEPERKAKMVRDCDGFLYLIARLGITGESKFESRHIAEIVKSIKIIQDIPVAIGFGISHPDHVETIYDMADGAIIGSYLVRAISEANDPVKALKDEMEFLQKGVLR